MIEIPGEDKSNCSSNVTIDEAWRKSRRRFGYQENKRSNKNLASRNIPFKM